MPIADAGARRRLRRWTLAGIAALFLATSVVAATYTPLFAARHLRLRGSGDIPRQEVLALARVDHRSNVFHLDVRAVERRLERDPRVLDARVTTSLPNGVSIAIVRRAPVAVLGPTDVLVGADGVVIGPARDAVDLPVLVNAGGGPAEAEALVTAAATAGALGPALLRVVDAVVVSRQGEVRVRLAAGFPVSFGHPSELEAKAASLAALLAWVEQESVTVISADLTVPGSPTAQLERGADAVAVP
jgi:cell division septal protein FtsQ